MPAHTLDLLVPLFALISFAYASVGMGGGSAYLAMMVLFGVDHRIMPPLALALNLVVASGSFAHYLRAGHFRSRFFPPLVATSIPAAFLAAQIPLERLVFQGILGALLLLASIRMLATRSIAGERPVRELGSKAPWILGGVGLVLGTVAGLTGIGGGIYLVPVLLLARIATPKEAAALSAGFVVLNSISGLSGRFVAGALVPWALFVPLAATVLVCGQLGAFAGARRYGMSTVQTVFGLILLAVSVRLLGHVYGSL